MNGTKTKTVTIVILLMLDNKTSYNTILMSIIIRVTKRFNNILTNVFKEL